MNDIVWLTMRRMRTPLIIMILVYSFSVFGMLAIPGQDETNSETFILLNFAKKLVLIAGTSYAGEIKKSVFSMMNYMLPFKDVLPKVKTAG